MSRPALAVFLLVLVAAVIWSLMDPMGLFTEAPVDRQNEETDVSDLREGSPVLAGKPGAVDPETGNPLWVEGERVGTVDLGLGTAALTGVVTGDGAPLFGARVRLALVDKGGHAVRTRRDGTWEIHGVPAGTIDVRATHKDFTGRTLTVPEFAEGASVVVETIDLERRRPSTDGLEIKVFDAFGRPLAGAKVMATTMMWNVRVAIPPEFVGETSVLERRGLTDDAGQVNFEAMRPETYDVVVEAEGYRLATQPGVVVSGGDVRHLRFQLIPGVTISGTILGPDGEPVPGAYVTGLQQPTFVMGGFTTADAAGHFSLDGLREGTYWVMAFHDSHGTGQANPVPSPSSGIEIRLTGAGRLAVTVKDAVGDPLTRYNVRPFKPGPYEYEYSPLVPCESADGRLEMDLPPGTYTLLVQGADGDVTEDTQAAVKVGETTEVMIVLPASLVVKGVVVGPDGEHLADAEVYVRRSVMPGGPKREQYARTDADGAFEIRGLAAEAIRLHVTKTGFASRILELDLGADGAPGEQTVKLGRGGVIQGRVTQGDEPAVGAQVNAFQSFFHAITIPVGGDGTYRFEGLTPGTWSISVGTFEFGAGGPTRSGLAVAEGSTLTVDLDLGVTQGTRAVEGQVVQGGQGVPGATVSIVDGRGWDHLITTTTDAGGRFRAEGVQPGGITVQVATPAGTQNSSRADVPAEGEVPPVTITLAGGGLKGRLTRLDGTPVSAAWIQVETAEGTGWGRIRAQITSDTDGVFQASGLSPGRYQVRVTGSEYAGFLSDPVDVSEGGLADLGTFRLAAGITLRGRVTDDTGAPVEDATISMRDAQGRPVYVFSLVTTGSDGRYALTGIEIGRYTVGFEARGYAPASQTVDLDAQGATVDGVLSRGGTVDVTVTDEAGTPLPGVRVGLIDAAGRPVERTLSLVSIFQGEVGRSGADGVASVPDLAPGAYTLMVQSGGTIVGDAPVVHVPPGQVARATLVLRVE